MYVTIFERSILYQYTYISPLKILYQYHNTIVCCIAIYRGRTNFFFMYFVWTNSKYISPSQVVPRKWLIFFSLMIVFTTCIKKIFYSYYLYSIEENATVINFYLISYLRDAWKTFGMKNRISPLFIFYIFSIFSIKSTQSFALYYGDIVYDVGYRTR